MFEQCRVPVIITLYIPTVVPFCLLLSHEMAAPVPSLGYPPDLETLPSDAVGCGR